MTSEKEILATYQECGKKEVELMHAEKKHREDAQKIVTMRQDLAVIKSKLADYHREISEPMLPALDPKLV